MASRSQYYHRMKELARSVRSEHGLTTPRVLRSDLRRIYKKEGIHIDLWPHRMRQLRGAYFHDENGATVMLAKSLPPDPMIFTMAHELKHHLVDRALGVAHCDARAVNDPIEIGAEVFAAELIFPEADFAKAMTDQGIGPGACTPEALVRLKVETKTTLSYAGLAKRAEFLGFIRAEGFRGVMWKKLEEQLYGEPIYKSVLRRRRAFGR